VASSDYYNDVFVYDFETDSFGRATASSSKEPCLLPPGCGPYPLNNNVPQADVRGDQLFTLGGEADAQTVCGEAYQHYPRLALRGTITVSAS
jgi:hypothetical protein